MNTHETYVSLETAKLLKEAGFDWKVNTLYFSIQDDDYPIKEELIRCADYFPNGDQRGTGNPFHNWNQLNTKRGDYYAFVSKKNFLEFNYETIKKDTTLISAPTLAIAQRWLREVKRIFVTVSVYAVIEQGHEITDSDKFSVYAETWDSQSEFWNKWTSLFEIDDFNTYEEAQKAGIQKALEIILKKGE